MKCPLDGTELVLAERQGVEIDYCPQCRGVWLDRGELDKLIERSEAYDKRDRSRDNDRDDDRDRDRDRYPNAPYQNPPYQSGRSRDDDTNRDNRYRDDDRNRKSGVEGIAGILGDAINKKMSSSGQGQYGHSGHKKKKKGGLLGELFDF